MSEKRRRFDRDFKLLAVRLFQYWLPSARLVTSWRGQSRIAGFLTDNRRERVPDGAV